MKAIGLNNFGDPDVLEVVELPEPHPGPGEVRIRVKAATVNPVDTILRAGHVAAMLGDFQAPFIPGMDAAGVIDALGEGVSGRLKIGDRVVAIVSANSRPRPMGAYAEQIVIDAEAVVPIPAGTDFPAASTLLMNGLTTQLALEALELRPGNTLAVTGAAGLVGGYAIQLGKAAGLRVIADAASADHDLVRSLGADIMVARGDDIAGNILAVAPEGVDGIVDAAIQNELVVPAIKDNGGLATLRMWNEPVPRGIKVHPIAVTEGVETAKLDRLRRQVEDGVLTLRVAEVIPAQEAAAAHRRVEAGGLRGKLVLDMTTLTRSA